MTEAPRNADTPAPGYYRTRLTRGGPFVPARIIETEGMWLLLIDGEPTCPEAQREPWRVPRMEFVAFSPRITEEAYLAMRAAPPAADPTQPVDLRAMPSLF